MTSAARLTLGLIITYVHKHVDFHVVTLISGLNIDIVLSNGLTLFPPTYFDLVLAPQKVVILPPHHTFFR